MKKLGKKFNLKIFIKSKFNIIMTLLNIVGIALGTYIFGFITTIILFLIFDTVMLGLNYILNRGTASQRRKKKKIAFITLLIIFIIGLMTIIGFIILIIKDAPQFNAENLYTKEASVLYDKDGQVITRLGAEQRIKVSYEQLPQVLIDAIIATEDARFESHNGFDLLRFLKASATQLLGQGGGGASTITMQVAKNAYTSPVSNGWEGIKRKFTDIYLAIFKIEKTYTKKEIMEFYVNSYYMGSGAYGVEQACKNYFGKNVSEINLSEAAMIAGLFKGGNAYDPYLYPENTEARRQTVLSLMVRHGYITEEERNSAKDLTVSKIVKQLENNDSNKYYAYQSFIDTVVEEVKKRTKETTGEEQNPYTVPMEIYTTMDRSKQEFMDNIMNGSTYNWENDAVQAGVIVTDTNTGAIVAVGGGRNKNAVGTYNYATMIKNQIGSTAKPLYDYGPAFEYNNLSPSTPIVDEEHAYSVGGNLHNWDSKYQGYMNIREALRVSRNTPALKTFQQISNKKINEFVTNLGLTPEISGGIIHEAHSVGGYNGESPLSMAAAYASFANGGTYIEPYSFTKIIYKDSDEEFKVTPITRKAMSEATAYLITDILIDTASYTTGSNKVNGVTYCSKTGTSNFSSETKKQFKLPSNAVNDLWVAGYSRDYAVAMWYGYNEINPKYVNRVSSGQNTRLFKAIIKGMFTGTKTFTMPSNIIEVDIEKETTTPMLASEFTPADLITTEVFKVGTEPTEVSPRFKQLEDVKNLNATETNEGVKITWDEVTNTPINESTIRNEFAKIFETDKSLNEFVNNRISYNKSHIGTITYDIYKKQTDGTLKLITSTNKNTYTDLNPEESNTYVVKTSYTLFKTNQSKGAETTINTAKTQSIITAILNGESELVLSPNTPYVEPNTPVIVLEDGIDITNKATITTKIEGPSSKIDTSIEGNYKITYTITYNGFNDILVKTIQIKNS